MFKILCFTCLAIILMAAAVRGAPLHVEPDKAPSRNKLDASNLIKLEFPHLQLDLLLEKKSELQRQNLLIPWHPELISTDQDRRVSEYHLPSIQIENANQVDQYHPWLRLDSIDWTSPEDYKSKIMMKRFLRQQILWPGKSF